MEPFSSVNGLQFFKMANGAGAGNQGIGDIKTQGYFSATNNAGNLISTPYATYMNGTNLTATGAIYPQQSSYLLYNAFTDTLNRYIITPPF